MKKDVIIPNELQKYKPTLSKGVLKLSYDKNKTNLNEIIKVLNKNKINFIEIKTFEGDLEDVFKKMVKKSV